MPFMSRHDVTDEEWQVIQPYLEEKRNDPRGRPSKDSRIMFNGVLWILKTGSSWRDLSKEFGPWQTVYKRFNKWSRMDVWEELLSNLSISSDLDTASVDGSYVKVHQHGTGAKGGISNKK